MVNDFGESMLFLAIDGGGTKTEAVVADRGGRCLGRAVFGGSNPNFVGFEAAAHAVAAAVRGALEAASASPGRIAEAACCIPGMKKHREELSRLLEDELGLASVLYDSDMESTLFGALGAKEGIAVLAGTGSFAMGVNEHGDNFVVGGWGPIIGDPGSGYAVSASALRAAALAHEGRGPNTLISDKLKRHYGVTDIAQLKSVISADNTGSLTYLVREAACEGDGVAKKLIFEAGEQLAELAQAVIKRLDMDDARYKVVLTGGMTVFGDPLLSAFTASLRRECPSITIGTPFGPPSAGALMLAYRAAGVPWSDDLLSSLKMTLL
ncbi:N-acetylglucosamine kinase [Paenibacillus sp. PAMC21692]|uniref:N-acetylglucosamine kinase n=1 Tax=Paenibacillus sp. PAMC21692 TaxID=2762320 RepID=UPI00164E9783|nr:BadF/BadG/BcrA/BcrD ATPase family protein [Paenibacillus sp. PAMC21692]QNK56625.1 hypothetical protein H7F31_29520 [Paenibacillus sp. PAMC21692]